MVVETQSSVVAGQADASGSSSRRSSIASTGGEGEQQARSHQTNRSSKTERDLYIDSLERKLSEARRASSSPAPIAPDDSFTAMSTGDEADEGQRLVISRPSQYDSIRIVPPTPSKDDSARRISFSQSVRISGGIHSHSHSRAQSHSNRAPSQSPPNYPSYPQQQQQQNGWLAHRSASVANTNSSGLPSRSSSPCSSIYAPLQPNAETCSTPFGGTPARPLAVSSILFAGQANANGNGNGAAQDWYDYHGMVQEQKRRKAFLLGRHSSSSSKRRRASIGSQDGSQTRTGEGGIWARMGAFIWGTGRDEPPLLPTSSSTNRHDYGTLERENGRTVGRRRSSLSISSDAGDPAFESDDEDDENEERYAEGAKTQAQVMFGDAPGRWLTPSWLWWKLKQVARCSSCF